MCCASLKRVITHAIAIGVLLSTRSASQPVVDKCGPPNWWAGMRHNEIQLMVYGADLHGVVAKTTSPHLQIQDVEPSASGKYCFVDVVIKADHLNDGTRHQAEIVLDCQSAP